MLKDNGYGELPKELGQEALDYFFDMRQGKAESIQDYIFREEILTVSLQKDTAIDLDEKIRGYWLMRTSNLTEREILESRSSTQGQGILFLFLFYFTALYSISRLLNTRLSREETARGTRSRRAATCFSYR